MKFTNLFTDHLPADSIQENYVRAVQNSCFSFVNPSKVSNPELIHYSSDVAELLNLDQEYILSKDFLDIFSGNKIHETSKPYAMAYAGHQFGQWAGQLGDGRAIGLGEINGFQVQLKGSGKTPYSRNADGLAVLRSSIREHLCSEAMHYLGISTTRSLSLIKTGDEVLRDMMYNGNPDYEQGAIVCRVAKSFIRFGNFELLAAQNDLENLKKLADFTIENYFSSIKDFNTKYIDFFAEVTENSKKMVIDWLRVGFVHGVMNTDNMSIHGLTIDYGPYGWIDDFDMNWTPNTTDAQGKRYRFGQQANIVLWNLLQLANAIYPLVNEAKPFEEILQKFNEDFDQEYAKMMWQKLGLFQTKDDKIIQQLLVNFELLPVDMTIFFRELSKISKQDSLENAFQKIEIAFYTEIDKPTKEAWIFWFNHYSALLQQEKLLDEERKTKMNTINPKYIFRNYIAQTIIEAAEKRNFELLNEVYEMLKKPYHEQPEHEKWYAKRPEWAKNKIGSSMLSCSS